MSDRKEPGAGGKYYGACLWPAKHLGVLVNDLAIFCDQQVVKECMRSKSIAQGLEGLEKLEGLPDQPRISEEGKPPLFDWKEYRDVFLLASHPSTTFLQKKEDSAVSGVLSPQPWDLSPLLATKILTPPQLPVATPGTEAPRTPFLVRSNFFRVDADAQPKDNTLAGKYVALEEMLFRDIEHGGRGDAFTNIVNELRQTDMIQRVILKKRTPTSLLAIYAAALSFYDDQSTDAVVACVFNTRANAPIWADATKEKYIRQFDATLLTTLPVIKGYREEYFRIWSNAVQQEPFPKKRKRERAEKLLACYCGFVPGAEEVRPLLPAESRSDVCRKCTRSGQCSKYRKRSQDQRGFGIAGLLKHDRDAIVLKGDLAKPAVSRLGRIVDNTKPGGKNIVLLSGPAGSGKSAAAQEYHAQTMERVYNWFDTNIPKPLLQRLNNVPNLKKDERRKVYAEFEKASKAAGDSFVAGIVKAIDCLKMIGRSKCGAVGLNGWLYKQLRPAYFKTGQSKDSGSTDSDWTQRAIANVLNQSRCANRDIALSDTDVWKSYYEWNFFEINCGTLSDEGEALGQSIKALFGDDKGPGLFQLASYVGGTVFLDEIADLPVHLQDMLLKPLEEGTVTRLGWEAYPEYVKNVRIVAATYKDLKALGREYQKSIEDGGKRRGFRPDLFTRLWKNEPVQLCSVSDYFLHDGHRDHFQNEWVDLVAGHPPRFKSDASDNDKKEANDKHKRLKKVLIRVYTRIERLIDEHARKYDSPSEQMACRRRICGGMTMRFFKQVTEIFMSHLEDPSKKAGSKRTKGVEENEDNATERYILEEYIPEMFDSLDKHPDKFG